MLDQIESIFAEDAVEHVVAVVSVRDALHPVLDWGLHSHEETEEDPSVGQLVAEPVNEEEKDGNELRGHCASDELGQDDFRPAMG